MAKKAGRPVPQFSSDDYIDFCVTEALVARASEEEAESAEEQERRRFTGKDARKQWAEEQGLV